MAALSTPQRILVVRLSHLGDIAQAIPLVHALRKAWPEAEIAWAVQPEFAGLVEPIARVIPFDRRGGLGAWKQLRAAFREWAPDLVLDAQGNWKSAVCARIASGAGERRARSVAFAREAWQEPMAARVTRPEHASAASGRHLVDRCMALAEHMIGERPPPRLDPQLTDDERTRGGAALEGIDAPVVLHPGVEGDPRSWPAERFIALADSLCGAGRAVVVLTGPGEAEVGRTIEARVPEARHVVGQRGLRELAGLFDVARARGGRLVAGDSGPAHVAASVGLPVTLIAGPEDPSRTGPWPVAGGADSPHTVAATPWSPRSIEDVAVDDVLDALSVRRPAP